MWSGLRARVRKALESKPVSFLLYLLIFLSTAAIIAESIADLSLHLRNILEIFEMIVVFLFTIEYLARAWTCVDDPAHDCSWRGRIRYLFTPLAIIDLLAILPFYLPIILSDLLFLRALRLLRVTRILKIGRHSEAFRTVGAVFRAKAHELGVTLYVLVVLLVIASCCMYYLEGEVQPESFSSIPATMWWGVATLTTVGYGDIYPITVAGKFVGACIAILGIGLFALPAGILGSGFIEELHRRERRVITCPHCGRDLVK